jgi:hypothetical protein
MTEFNQNDVEIIDAKVGSGSKKALIIAGILILIVIVFGVFRVVGSDSSELEDGRMDGSEMELVDGRSGEAMSDSNTASVIGGLNNFSRVQLAVLAGEFYDVQFEGEKVSCDTVIMVDQFIESTPAPLNSAMKALFEFDVKTDFLPGNFISSQSDLSFFEAKIEGGVAKIFLTGSLGPIAGECDQSRVQTQIRATAMQFSSVNDVEIMLNGEVLN